jgi:Na+-translocating ferredoxin:NAD+ oxidoreductase RnfG subunit
LSKEDGSIAFISYDEDQSGHYTPGMYGDSTETWDGTPAKELFKKFREEVLMGASQETINGMEPMHGDVDTYSGATVTPNNAIRMLQNLFKYHNAKY